MWNWSSTKTILLGITVSLVLFLAGFSTKAIILITVGILIFTNWIVAETNFIRKSHGSNIEELENKIIEIERAVKELKKKHK